MPTHWGDALAAKTPYLPVADMHKSVEWVMRSASSRGGGCQDAHGEQRTIMRRVSVRIGAFVVFVLWFGSHADEYVFIHSGFQIA